jgi:hypothetical protein
MICLDTNIVTGIVSGRSSALRHRLGEQMLIMPPTSAPTWKKPAPRSDRSII